MGSFGANKAVEKNLFFSNANMADTVVITTPTLEANPEEVLQRFKEEEKKIIEEEIIVLPEINSPEEIVIQLNTNYL
jgi:hypothetical protein